MSINANNAALNEILETINELPGSKEEQVKAIDITENGTTVVTPDEGMTLGGVTVNVAIESGGGDELPDWDDDSPIIAKGYGYSGQTFNYWELTEKGTMRWKIDPNGTMTSHTYATAAGWNNTVVISSQSTDYLNIASKIKQIDLSEKYDSLYMGYAANCKRVRIQGTLKNCTLMAFGSLREIICNDTSKLKYTGCYAVEKIVLSPAHTAIVRDFARGCCSLKEINLDNIISYDTSCFEECLLLKDIVFNPGLVSIGSRAFYRTAVKSFTFQTPTSSPPTVASNAFGQCRATSVTLYDGWNMDLYVQELTLTQESLHDIAEKYADMTGAEIAPVLRLGTANINKMDEEHIAMLENKNINYS